MHHAPPVSYAVGRSAVYGCVLAAVWLAGACTISVWCYVVDSISWRQGLCLGVLLITGGFALNAWGSSPQGFLGWTMNPLGQWVWTDLQQQQTEGRIHVRLDWQRGLLLQFTPVLGTSLWLWMSASQQPTQWQALRCAVYSPATMATKLTPDTLYGGTHPKL
jgi:hypothetical protein